MTEKLRVKIARVEAVDRDPEPETKAQKALSDYSDTGLRVLGVPFGGPIKGRDLDGEAFHEDTAIWLAVGDAVNLTYYHGLGPDDPEAQQEKPALIGKAVYTGVDERGHWFDISLDEEEELAQRIIKAGADGVKASSGAVGHLVRMGKGGLIDNWPVGEIALFDTNEWRLPANDFAVIEARAANIPEAMGEAEQVVPVAAKRAEAATTESKNIERLPKEVDKMDEDEKTVAAEAETVSKTEFEALKADLEALKKAAPGIEKGAPVVMKAANLGDPDPVQDFENWIYTGVGRIKKHTSIVDLSNGRGGKYKAALQEGTDSEGGYLVPVDTLNRIIEKRGEMSLLGSLGVQTFNTDRDQFTFPTEGTSMTKFTIVAEEGDISPAENEPTFGSAGVPPVSLYKFMKLIKISDELDEDYNTGLSEFLAGAIGRSWAATENYYVQVGSGSSQPQGAFVGGTAGLTLDSATAIGAAEIPELIGKLKIPYRDRAVMVMNRTTGAYLAGLTGNQFVFRAPLASQLWANGEDMGIGYPVKLTEDAAAIAAGAKSLLFGNFEFYGWVRNRSLRVKRLVEAYATTGQIGILAQFRAGGAVLQAEAFQYATHPTA
ncbi:MAG: phage major capsid protein [Bellilinea sp.]